MIKPAVRKPPVATGRHPGIGPLAMIAAIRTSLRHFLGKGLDQANELEAT